MSGELGDDVKGSSGRLWALVDQRTKPGADKTAIDKRIWDLFGEDWAVMFTDLSGFSRHVAAFGIIHFLQVIWEQQKLLLPIVTAHDGILIKVEADSLMIVFRRPDRALECAVAMQRACQEASKPKPPEEKILLCIGLGYGKILRIGDADVFGAEVNAASKLGEDRAKAHEILVTDAVRVGASSLKGVTFEPREVDVPGAEKSFAVGYEHAE
jgi:adenylate cyclase